MMKAKDIMTSDVITVSPDVEISEVAKLLLKHRISAAPVMDQEGHILGMISEGDFLRRSNTSRARSWWLSFLAYGDKDFMRVYGTRARDVMTCEVISTEEDAPLSEIAWKLERHGIKRLPVLRDDRLIGIVSRADILRGLAIAGLTVDVAPTADDDTIREKIMNLLEESIPTSLQAVSVIVVNGVVYLWGIVEAEEEREIVRVAAENIAGVAKVHNFLKTLSEALKGI